MSAVQPRQIALQFGRIKHFNEGLSEVSRQLGLAIAARAIELKAEQGWHFHFILAEQWHGMFGDDVSYHTITDRMRWPHRFPVQLDLWHGLHQHMRHRPPLNSRHQVITVHDLNHLYAKTGMSLWWQNMRMRRHLRQAEQLTAISQFVADDIHRHAPDLPSALVIHNGVADLSGAAQEAVTALEGQDFLLHISRMSASKNVDALIAMAASWPEQKLVLVGPSSADVDRHKQRVGGLGLANVLFVADASEAQKAWLYAHCKAFLFPSLLEGFGLPPIEAMYFGKPVIVARRSCLPEVCGEGAAYWDDFSPSAMKQVVMGALAGHHLERSRSQAKRYSWPSAADMYCQLYARLMNDGKPQT